jgi:homoserine kinase type II
MDKPMNGESIARVARHWNLEVTAERPDIPLAGSPERSLFRTVVGDPEGGLFVLEQLPADILARKREIAATVEVLARRGLVGVHPYLRNRNGDFVTVTGGRFWQISPFISGEELPRPEYTLDAWRGKSMARGDPLRRSPSPLLDCRLCA